MNAIVGSHDIVLLTLDTLRFDVAQQELAAGRLPNLARFISQWEPRHTPGSFTYAAHHAMFAGFFPTPVSDPLAPRLMAVDFHGSRSISAQTKCFSKATIVEGLAEAGYHTVCIGGVGFFNQQTELGCTLPSLFQTRYWGEETGVTDPKSTQHQIEQAKAILGSRERDEVAFLFINISAIHQPNYFYADDAATNNPTRQDSLATHAAALRYVDSQLGSLFDYFATRRDTLFILTSDHGTCYGDDGFEGHRLAHEVVWTVPYADFVQEARQ
uniref:STM4013/SEN3800 family hydrolase n=1 Tax=Thaumasiovibrio occultus TaxID=1891184 RepID=UPI00192CFBA3|nr:STM4013/SEN3800 family hydrolase [Thaumasiovibrio occultus]